MQAEIVVLPLAFQRTPLKSPDDAIPEGYRLRLNTIAEQAGDDENRGRTGTLRIACFYRREVCCRRRRHRTDTVQPRTTGGRRAAGLCSRACDERAVEEYGKGLPRIADRAGGECRR